MSAHAQEGSRLLQQERLLHGALIPLEEEEEEEVYDTDQDEEEDSYILFVKLLV